MNKKNLLRTMETEILAKVDWDDHWPDQIDGIHVCEYRLDCDYSCPDYDRGYYVTTIWSRNNVPLCDIMCGGGDYYYLRDIADRD